MSLQGERAAFIPIGLSCQPVFQLYRNLDLLQRLVGEPLAYRSSFFNWVLVSADDVGRTIERLVAEPITQSSIRVPETYHRANTLAGHKVWLWHEKPSHQVTTADAIAMASKYEHLRQNFLRLCASTVRYFVLCNAQNNLDTQDPYLYEGMHLEFDDAVLRNIKGTLDALFPNGNNHVIEVARRDRLKPAMVARPCLVSDQTVWEGSEAAWRDVLSYWFARKEWCERLPSFATTIG